MDFEAAVIGSGFGGAILTGRMAKKWGEKVVVLERGKRYPMYSFARTPEEMARNFWNHPKEQVARPSSLGQEENHGLFDIRDFRHMDVITAAGLGGGSLIYANVFMLPPEEVFADWPSTCNRAELEPYYAAAKEVLGARPVPAMDEPDRVIKRTLMFEEMAKEMGRESKRTDLIVFFGNDFDKPLPRGHQEENRFGKLQTSCTYCAECDIGCNTHSKNTLDHNYLHVAEEWYGASVRTEHLVSRVVPLDSDGSDSPAADGSHGYRVYYEDLTEGNSMEKSLTAQRVVVSAGAVGSTEILLRCKFQHQTLPRISAELGRKWSANGDFLSVVMGAEEPTESVYGPVITQRIDFNLFDKFDRTRAFILEDAGFPNLLAWFVQASKPGFMWLGPLRRSVRDMWDRFTKGNSTGHIGYAMADALEGDVANHSTTLLCMGLDQGDGVITLDKNNNAKLDWPYKNSMRLYQGILGVGERVKALLKAKVFVPLPTWLWPSRRNVCVHALGGCSLGDDVQSAVTSAAPENFGEVFGYKGLYVADGGLLPGPVGANPCATISALSERVAEGITGIKPSGDL